MLATTLTLWPSLIGGLLIGTASALGLALTGKVPGISGICARIFRSPPGEAGRRDRLWRMLFLIGLVGGAGLAFWSYAPAAAFRSVAPLAVVAAAGFAVGLGTRVGGGCTSGHGVCGIGSGSRRSLVATVTFMAAAIATVAFVRAVLPSLTLVGVPS